MAKASRSTIMKKAWAKRKAEADTPQKVAITAKLNTLCGQLEDTISALEVRILKSIARINSLI